MAEPVIIEVALNGATTHDRNPNAPQDQQALIEDAIRCIEAGASVVHTHAPDISIGGKDGAQQYLDHFQPPSSIRPWSSPTASRRRRVISSRWLGPFP